MAEYKGIHGTKVQNYTSDPDNPITGQVWYNETDQVLKFQFENTTGAWSKGGNLNTASQQLAGGGIQTSTVVFGGESATAVASAITESYNGSSWTEVNDLNSARYRVSSTGSSNTNALSYLGRNASNTKQATNESWNGTSWTEL